FVKALTHLTPYGLTHIKIHGTRTPPPSHCTFYVLVTDPTRYNSQRHDGELRRGMDGSYSEPLLRELDEDECYRRFTAKQPNFAASYAAYHHFRKSDWIPKSGLKYGADFVLYRKG